MAAITNNDWAGFLANASAEARNAAQIGGQAAQGERDRKLKELLEGKKMLAEESQASAVAKQKAGELAVDKAYKESAAKAQLQNAQTQEGYRRDQMRLQDEQIKLNKLKVLMGGGGGAGVDGKPLSAEAQKYSNTVDVGRDGLNRTESLIKENPRTAILEKFTPGFVATLTGGKLKEIADSKAVTKEAMQSLITGAAASGEQVPAFQGWSGPGIMDIVKGGGDSSSVRDTMNTLQQGYKRQSLGMNPEMLKAAGMQNDPVAQQAMQQQQAASQMKQQQKLSQMAPEDAELYQEIQGNPQHPKAAAALTHLKRKYGAL